MAPVQNNLPFTSAIRFLGALGGLCAIIGVASGVVMLLLMWATGSAPHILTQLSLLLVPLALLLLVIVMILSVLRRRASGSPAGTR
ncbi:hypothetical protein [Rothia aerolata]|uniref:Uncharacterized protein n=1 Tax=Rothia aerolata TaxID=1812262 RepID=A0A917MSG9_9MICC|nr:hypothetical protein [Rothia aerolata]GGH61523.1 hypothetical protein GCM10007359_10770 [Rothia aerolata]